MERRQFLKQSAAALALGAASPALLADAGKSTRKPNVVFILTDEWRGQATGYAGDGNAHTPTLNALAQQSANFTNIISGLPLCCPARASLMTGQYPLTHGVFINDVPLAPKGLTMGEVFKNAGYRTGYIGKWHLHGSPDGHYGRRGAYIPPDKRFGWDYWKANECEHDYNHSRYYEGNDPTPKYWPGYDAIAESEDACGFIQRNANADAPFALVLSMAPPHFPYATAPAEYRAMYADRSIKLRDNVPAAKDARATASLRGYYAHIAALDDCVKRVLTQLDQSKIADDTVVVFTADHGDMVCSQGLEGKLYPWDESLRIPLLVRYPRGLGRKGQRVETPANSPDIMPTLLGLCGLPIPDSVQGTDFSMLLNGKGGGEPKSAYINNPVSTFQLRQSGFDSYRGVRTPTHTYVRAIEGPWLLYDNMKDPFQKHNLANKPEAKHIQEELDAEVMWWRKKLHDDFLPGAEYLKQANLAFYFETKTPIGQYSSPWGDWGPTMSKAG